MTCRAARHTDNIVLSPRVSAEPALLHKPVDKAWCSVSGSNAG